MKRRERPSQKLAAYNAKRDFHITREPEGRLARERQGPLTFMVHKHDATRVHYDVRLEMDGVLASWAVPKGPSYDPGQKRLAVRTEDHPLAYGGFEGRILDGEYGAGDSIIWDRGTYDTMPPGKASEQRARGRLTIELHGEKLVGRWHLVRTRPIGGKQPWLMFKANDETANPSYDVIAERPESVHSGRRVTRGPLRRKTVNARHLAPEQLLQRVWPPMRATLSSPARAPAAEFVYEVKYDGYRGVAAISGGRLAFQTRNGIDLAGRFPDIAKALSRLHVGDAVIDGEIAAIDRQHVSHFQDLLTPGADERFFAFDLLWLDGEDLRGRPLEQRRELLESVLSNTETPLEISERVDSDDVDAALAEAHARRLEGLIAKRKGSRYVGTRSSDWLKLKTSAAQELAIVGYTPMKNGTPQIGALLLAVADGRGGFHYAGKVGTGYPTEIRHKLRELLDADRVDAAEVKDVPRFRDAVWVKPRYVAQVAFTEWTSDGKLRHPSFQGLRVDKKPEECVREDAPRAGVKRVATRHAAKSRRQSR